MYRPPVPWCQPQRPFSLCPPQQLLGRFVLPLPDGHPEIPVFPDDTVRVAHFFPEYLAARVRVERETASDLATISSIIRHWFSDPSGSVRIVGNAATLTRILAVLELVSVPDRLKGDSLFDFAFMSRPRCVPVPGGNVDTLMWLAWRYVWAVACAFDALDRDFASHADLASAQRALFEVVSLCGTVPGHHLAESADWALPDEQLCLWSVPLYRWNRRVVAPALTALGAGVHAGRRRRDPARGMRRQIFSIVEPWDYYSRLRNVIGFSLAGAQVLSALVDLLRIVGHVVAVARRALCPLDKSVGLPYGVAGGVDRAELSRLVGVWATLLRGIVERPVGLLDGHFVASAEDCALDASFWALAERDMTRWVGLHAWYGVAFAWGVLPGDPDSFQRAGPRCFPVHCGLLMPPDVYRQPVQPHADYGQRAGSYSLSARLRDALRVRAEGDTDVPPPPPGRDVLRWTDPVLAPLPALDVGVADAA